MTAIPAPHGLIQATAFERVLLRAASALDVYVAARLDRRTDQADRQRRAAQFGATAARREAEARSAFGLLPR